MRTLFNITRGEIKRVFADQLAHPGDSITWIVYTVLLFVAVIVILSGITGASFDAEAQLAVLVGWLSFQVAGTCMVNLPDDIRDEGETGTLEQIAIGPVPLIWVFFARSVAYFLSTGALGFATGALLLLFVVRTLPTGGGSLFGLLFLISLLGAYGLGFVFAGLTLVVKRISALTGVVFSLMIFLTGALVGLEELGWIFDMTRLVFPLTWGISLMRSVVDGADLSVLISSGELLGLGIHSAVYLVLGVAVFFWGYRRARVNGTLSHY